MTSPIVYAGCPLDRAAHLRIDAAWMGERLGDPASRVLPVWRDRCLVLSGERPGPAVLAGAAGADALALAQDAAFLGLDADGAAWFACDLSPHDEASVPTFGQQARFLDLGQVVTRLSSADSAILAYARALLHWHRRHRFCGGCGGPTEARHGGHLRVCLNPECRSEHFPRTDPVVIMLLTRAGAGGSEDECLLARQRHWIPGLMSAIAGFVEPGETLEEAVRREVREETGLEVERLRYRASQPWPFPSSLMLGFHAVVPAGVPLRIDQEELEDARWFRRQDVATIRAQGLRLPFRGTIARALIEGWLGGNGEPE